MRFRDLRNTLGNIFTQTPIWKSLQTLNLITLSNKSKKCARLFLIKLISKKQRLLTFLSQSCVGVLFEGFSHPRSGKSYYLKWASPKNTNSRICSKCFRRHWNMKQMLSSGFRPRKSYYLKWASGEIQIHEYVANAFVGKQICSKCFRRASGSESHTT